MPSYMFKILLTGDGAVGKTSIRERYMGRGFTGDYLKTIGADFASKSLNIENIDVKMQIFDLAGQDAYVSARKSFFKGGHAAFLVFDVQDPQSLTNLKQWIEDCTNFSNNSIQTFIALGNKADLVETRQVTSGMAVDYLKQMAAKFGITFYYMDTSAKTGLNIDTAFDIMARRLLNKRDHKLPIFEQDGVYEIAPGGGSGNVEKEVAAAVETVAQASNALIGGVLEEGEKNNERIEKLEKTMKKMIKKINLLEKKMDRVVTALRSVMSSSSAEGLEEPSEPMEEEEEETAPKSSDFGVPSIPKKK